MIIQWYTDPGHPQPPASNMMELTWDPELARLAQTLADQCVFSHECADCRRVERFRSEILKIVLNFKVGFNYIFKWIFFLLKHIFNIIT